MKKIIVLFLFLNGCFFCYGQNENLPDNLYPSSDLVIPYHSEWSKKHYPQRIKIFKQEPLQYGDIVFLGNSITEQGRNWAERFQITNVKNRGIAGDVTEGVLARLGEINHFKPKAVFILIGINDLFQGKSAEFVAENILKIAAAIHQNSKDTKVYVQTILPTKSISLISKIQITNKILKKNKARFHYKLIALHDLFSDKKDVMKKDLTVDGVHLNEKGYQLWVNKVKKQVMAANKKQP